MKKIVKGFLSAITIISASIGTAIFVSNKYEKKLDDMHRISDKNQMLYTMMNKWVKIKHKKKNIAEYLVKNNYKRIAIYGMGIVGDTLVSEIKNTDVEIVYGIDQNAEEIYYSFEVCTPDEVLKPVDLIIVTPIAYFGEIEANLRRKIDCHILSLDDILYEL